jgi:hypothetical protein
LLPLSSIYKSFLVFNKWEFCSWYKFINGRIFVCLLQLLHVLACSIWSKLLLNGQTISLFVFSTRILTYSQEVFSTSLSHYTISMFWVDVESNFLLKLQPFSPQPFCFDGCYYFYFFEVLNSIWLFSATYFLANTHRYLFSRPSIICDSTDQNNQFSVRLLSVLYECDKLDGLVSSQFF